MKTAIFYEKLSGDKLSRVDAITLTRHLLTLLYTKRFGFDMLKSTLSV